MVSLAFSPDGATLAVGRAGGTVALWDCARAVALRELPGNALPPSTLALSRDGAYLASGFAGRLVITHVPSGVEVFVHPRKFGAVTAMAFSRDGAVLLAASEASQIGIFRVPEREHVADLTIYPLRAGAGYVKDEHGLVELLGDVRGYASCAGDWPLELCAETALVPGLWSKVFAGDRGYLEPPP